MCKARLALAASLAFALSACGGNANFSEVAWKTAIERKNAYPSRWDMMASVQRLFPEGTTADLIRKKLGQNEDIADDCVRDNWDDVCLGYYIERHGKYVGMLWFRFKKDRFQYATFSPDIFFISNWLS
jgi:hypothetical protein